MPDEKVKGERVMPSREEREARLHSGGPMPFLSRGVAPDTIWRCPICGFLTAEEGESSCPHCLGKIGDEWGDLWQPYLPESRFIEARSLEQVASERDRYREALERIDEWDAGMNLDYAEHFLNLQTIARQALTPQPQEDSGG